ncbi:winged helix-turn-helix transcriptional regulator [Jannaschia aquimarina]|uniref:YybR_1 protein n=1 Tax=Jannaschia aquimarina TaxID=935700 RepID=A0A0D1CTJ9_9RHOB|nr:helix-turn-helix domain-containing protein [Jannaschia aquimarina]KIT18102.1 putative HTH-type transcriptional regulator YybR [Jannaschia aquimarina]SNT40856.1 transcriptional regulator, HxlR family [Jannaschia aquimarina]
MRGSYGQFCPVAMAAEIVCTRWTVLLLRELMVGSTHFGELRRGVPRMSPALLSKRLRELEASGIVLHTGEGLSSRYGLTQSGRDLAPVVEALGVWGQHWIETEPSLDNADPRLLMWDMHRTVVPDPLSAARRVIAFEYPELSLHDRYWWLVIEPDGTIDLCSDEPGFGVDLYVSTDLRTMTAIWLGQDRFSRAVDCGSVTVDGSRAMAGHLGVWLRGSHFAPHAKRRPDTMHEPTGRL